MAEFSLPDDYSQWPVDPFRLLGLSRDADERTAKKAYTALLRRFHPEDHPEHFRRIRAAYETVKAILENDGDVSYHALPSRGEEETQPAQEESSQQSPTRHETEWKGAPPSTLASQIDAAWKRACEGNLEGAYRDVMDLARSHPTHPELCIRRYWLLILRPSLDIDNNPLGVLEAVLVQMYSHALAQLYVDALAHEPDRAATEAVWMLMQQQEFRSHLMSIMRYRWRQLRQADRWEQIQAELNSFELALLDDPYLWQTLNLLALEIALFGQQTTLAKRLLSRLTDLGGSVDVGVQSGPMAMNYDRIDHLSVLINEIKPAMLLPGVQDTFSSSRLVAFLCETALETDDLCLVRMKSEILEDWIQHPDAALESLDQMQAQYPSFGYELLNRLAQLLPGRGDIYWRPEELAARLRSDIIRQHRIRNISDTADYNELRWSLLKFCREEWATFEAVAQVLVNDILAKSNQTPRWVPFLQSDMAMATLVKGTLLFWS